MTEISLSEDGIVVESLEMIELVMVLYAAHTTSIGDMLVRHPVHKVVTCLDNCEFTAELLTDMRKTLKWRRRYLFSGNYSTPAPFCKTLIQVTKLTYRSAWYRRRQMVGYRIIIDQNFFGRRIEEKLFVQARHILEHQA